MPQGRVILAASEARVRGQASRNSSATNIAICLIEDQLQSNGPTHLRSGQSLTGAGRRSELSLLLSYSGYSFLKKGDCVLAGISGEWAEAWRAIGLAAATRKGAGRGLDSSYGLRV